jgi:hypothetical protein
MPLKNGITGGRKIQKASDDMSMNDQQEMALEAIRIQLNPHRMAREDEKYRTGLAEQTATDRGFGACPEKKDATRNKTPQDLAKRAIELQAAGRAQGKELSSAAAVRQAYEEAGVPLTAQTKKEDDKKDDKKAADPMERQVMARKMAEEAKEFVATEEKAGRTVTMAEAIKHVYEKAGVPTR